MEIKEIDLIELYRERKREKTDNENLIISKLENSFSIYDKETAIALVDYYIRTYGQVSLKASGY